MPPIPGKKIQLIKVDPSKVRWQVEDHHEKFLTGKIFIGGQVTGELLIEKSMMQVALPALKKLGLVITTNS